MVQVDVHEAKEHLSPRVELVGRRVSDRILLARAVRENLTLVTRDSALGAYGVDVAW